MRDLNTYSRMEHICRVDGAVDYGRPIARADYQQEFQRSVLMVLDRKSDEFADIAQRALTSMVSSNAFYVYSAGARFAVSAASAGVSAARGIGEINELKSYVISGIGSSASEVESHLPGFAGIMQQRSVIEEPDALVILEN